MQFSRTAIFLVGLAFGVVQAQTTQTAALIPMDEPVTNLLTLNPATPPNSNTIPGFKYVYNGTNAVATLLTQSPLLCGNTAAASGTNPIGVTSQYYSANALAGAAPQNEFVFGASSALPTKSAIAYGVTNLVYNGSAVQFGGDPLDALVCYGLDANGVHKVTRDLFADGFEVAGTDGLIGNSTVTVSVFHLPAGAGDYYAYTVDVTIPPLPSGTNCNSLDCNFALIEGYDSSVLDPGNGQWCLAPAGAQSCSSPPPTGGTSPVAGDININYSNFTALTNLAAPIAPASAKQLHFVVVRYLKSGVSALPSSGAPVAMAALFSPLDLLENKLDDNVATGNNTLANVAPSVTTDSTFTTALAALQENTDSGTLTFSISDPDSPESGSNLLTANVTLNLPTGIAVPVAPTCTLVPNNPSAPLPVNRTCTITIPLQSQPGFWNASVGAQYQNQFNNVATDTTNGTYASGVSASIQIVATDAQGKNSAAVPVPVHIFSKTNNPPMVSFINATQWPLVTDPNDSPNQYPTFTCSVSAGTNSGGCGAPNQFNTSLISIDFSNAAVLTGVPGPTAAFDELASQTTVANNYTGIDGGNVDCTNEQAADIFAPSSQTYGGGGPLISIATGNGTASVGYKVNFAIPSAAPATAVSALCSLANAISDAMQGGGAFPPPEQAAPSAQKFRIVVNP